MTLPAHASNALAALKAKLPATADNPAAPNRDAILAALRAAGIDAAAAIQALGIVAAADVPLEIDTSVRPAVVAWIADGRILVATAWKPASAFLGGRGEPSTYIGAITSHPKARFATIATEAGRMLPCWTMPADALSCAALDLLESSGWSVRTFGTMRDAVEALDAEKANAKMRPAKRRKGTTAAPSTGAAPAAVDLSRFGLGHA